MIRFVLLMGLVSLFADVVYEGARSVTGPFLATLAVSAAMLGLIIGVSEFAAHGFRLISGYIADRTGKYWLLTFLGYALVLAIPMLALANTWQIAAALIFFERLGKAIRTPARDSLLAAVKKRGTAFGIHEAMDQIGAFAGPIIFFAALQFGYGYRAGFTAMLIPALLALVTLKFAKDSYPYSVESITRRGKLEGRFWIYAAFTFFSIAAFANFQIVSYHFKLSGVEDATIPLLYAVAMGVDAVAAIVAGRLYDRISFLSLSLIPLLTPLSVFASFKLSPLFGVVLWGAVMGMQESVMRAAVADVASSRATAYGIFNTVTGVAFFAGSVIFGYLYEISVDLMVVFSASLSIVAAALLVLLSRK